VEYHNFAGPVLGQHWADPIPYLSVHMNPLEQPSFTEVWCSEAQVSYGRLDDFSFAADGENLFGTTSQNQHGEDLGRLGIKVYDNLFSMIFPLHYPYLYRMWNFIPHINRGDSNDLERYKSFCYGRAMSFISNSFMDEPMRFPAATGIGCHSGRIGIYFLAAAFPRMTHLENPRQMPAYKYPQQYGPKSPSFARATIYHRGDDSVNLYISGTASVIGHESVYPGNIEKQMETTLENIRVLISAENLERYGFRTGFTLQDLRYAKVYVRHPEHFLAVRSMVEDTFQSVLLLNADICRNDLLMEIEGII
jgi:chorismate lyase/3-hydroxybenzoate synthase